MILTNIKNVKKNHGFTIVELLVVIVVIGILAAITIISYTGITARANTSSALSAANNVVAKSEVFAFDGPTLLYPASLGALTVTALSSTTYYLSGITFSGTLLAAAPGTPSTINYYRCGHKSLVAAPASLGEISTVTGAQVGYWNYTNSATVKLNIGQVSGLVGTYNIACFITTVVGT